LRYVEYSHRHGKELLQVLHPAVLAEVKKTLTGLPPFPHGKKKGVTVKQHIADAFVSCGWEAEGKADFRTDKDDYLDLCKRKVAIEMEFSRFEMFFRDFFRFMLLYERREIDAGIIITFDEMAYQRWEGEAKAYKSARASFRKLVDFLKGDYASVVSVPLWCIGIE
jgi:hypothetical protein